MNVKPLQLLAIWLLMVQATTAFALTGIAVSLASEPGVWGYSTRENGLFQALMALVIATRVGQASIAVTVCVVLIAYFQNIPPQLPTLATRREIAAIVCLATIAAIAINVACDAHKVALYTP